MLEVLGSEQGKAFKEGGEVVVLKKVWPRYFHRPGDRACKGGEQGIEMAANHVRGEMSPKWVKSWRNRQWGSL